MSLACAVIVFLLGFAGHFYNSSRDGSSASVLQACWEGLRWWAFALVALWMLDVAGFGLGPVIL